MKNKSSKLSESAKELVFGIALTVLATTAHSQSTYTFGYTGAIQALPITAGNYEIECWGADGSRYSTSSTNTKGGYSKGEYLSAGPTTLYIGVGQTKGAQTGGNQGPTFNGGGSGVTYGGSGGGASHVATAPGVLSSLSGNQSAVLIVAGGGGGSGYSTTNGGHGGGLTGQNGQIGSATTFAGGGTQTAGGAGGTGATNGAAGSFGQGGGGTGNGGGGGGGWYGGGNGAGSGTDAGGGGGSAYIGGVTSGVTYTFGDPNFLPNPDPIGHGYVIVRELCSISLSVTGLGSNGELCEGNTITISTDAVSNYSWTDGGIGPVLVAAPLTSTVYGLTAMSPSNCITSAQVSITVNPLPVVNVAPSAQAICQGESVVLFAGGADTYSWSTSATTSMITQSPNQTTTYSVTGTNTLTGCERTEMVTVNVIKPTVAIIGNSVICKGNTTTLTAFGDGATYYSWSTGMPGQSIIDAPANHSIYAVTANVSTLNINCSALSTFTVLVNPLPEIVAKPDRFSVCRGETVEFSATGAVNYSWTWKFETSNAPTFVVAGDQLGDISVNVTGTDANGCSNMVSTAAQVYACTGINETLSADEIISVYPNPSQGDINIVADMQMNSAELELLLFNETGQVVRKLQLNGANEYKTNISGLSSGIYFITGYNGNKRISSKITITR